MALSEKYIVASDLESLFRNKDTGLPLANGKLYFYRDAARDVPKEVFQLSGTQPDYNYTSMGAVITLSSIGTVQNSGGDNEIIYWYPWTVDANGNEVLDLYYISVTDENGIEQFSREAWPNITAATSPVDNNGFKNTNQIANPQFTNIFINEGFSTTLTVSGADNVFAIGPDWDLVASGTGTIIISREEISGNENVITSPPYVLDINVPSGVTTCYLRQRMQKNSGLWASTDNMPIYLSACIVGRNENPGSAGIQIIYRESSGGSDIVILDELFQNSGYSLQTGSTASPIPASTNVNRGTEGYIDILVSLLPSSHVRISSIQVVPTLDEAGPDFITYDVNSSNREEALQGDYYLPNLSQRNADSILTGWDFAVNPYQLGLSGNVTTTPQYICDQTIALCTGSNVAWQRNNEKFGLTFTTADTNQAFAICQYLTLANAKKIVGNPLSVNIAAHVSSSSDAVTARVYLVRTGTATSVPSLPTLPGTLASSGVFTLTPANGWTEIPRSGLDTARGVLPQSATFSDLSVEDDLRFTGWEITDNSELADTNKFMAIVTFSYADASTTVMVDSISVAPSVIPSRPATKTFTQTRADCEYYYQKSYRSDIPAGTVTSEGAFVTQMKILIAASNGTMYPLTFGTTYATEMRATPNIVIYSPAATTNSNVNATMYENAASVVNANVSAGNWAILNSNSNGFNLAPNSRSTSLLGPTLGFTEAGKEAVIAWHYVADARIGIV